MADPHPEIDIILENINELLTLSGNNTLPRVQAQLQDLGVIEKGAIALKGDRIAAVGTTQKLREQVKLTSTTEIIDCTGKTALPGFIDPHTHLVFAGAREHELVMKLEGLSYLEILEQGGGILSTVTATRAAGRETLLEMAAERLNTMLLHGTTTLEAKSGYGLTTDAELKILEVAQDLQRGHAIDIASTFLGAHAVPPEFENRPDDYLDHIISEMLPKIQASKLAEFSDIFCEQNVFSIDQSNRYLTAAKNFGLIPKLHADELTDLGGAQLAAELGAISADHLEMTTATGYKALANSKTIGVLLPATPFTLMSNNYPDARKMIEAGVPIALATDFNPNCWVESMQFIITLACYKLKMLPSEAIVASTINAAHALNRADRVGSLEIGKQADIILLDVPNHLHIPYHFSTNLIDKVLKNGKLVVDNGAIV